MSTSDQKLQSPLDEPIASSQMSAWLAGVLAVTLHGAMVAGAVAAATVIAEAPELLAPLTGELVEIPVETEPPEPPPAPPKRRRAAPKVKPSKTPPPDDAPAEAARAGQVLTQTPSEPEVVDFGDTFVTGSHESYAGGTTDAHGKGDATRGVDRSRPIQLAGRKRWNCPFPAEAEELGIRNAVVSLRVVVDANDRLQSVRVARDPGYGFGRAATKCARRKRWLAALDRAGRPYETGGLVKVHFER